MTKSNIREKIKKYVFDHEGDLFGITPAQRLNKAPEGHRPTDLMPGAKSIIVVGKRCLKGMVDTAPSFPWAIEYDRLNRLLEDLAYGIARKVEDMGFNALPVPVTGYGMRQTSYLDFLCLLSLRHAAVAAGIGGFGKNQLLLSPEFGPRIRLTAILTDKVIDFDPPFNKRICTDCNMCIKACPSGALSKHGIDKSRCSCQLLENARKFGSGICGVCIKVCPIGK